MSNYIEDRFRNLSNVSTNSNFNSGSNSGNSNKVYVYTLSLLENKRCLKDIRLVDIHNSIKNTPIENLFSTKSNSSSSSTLVVRILYFVMENKDLDKKPHSTSKPPQPTIDSRSLFIVPQAQCFPFNVYTRIYTLDK